MDRRWGSRRQLLYRLLGLGATTAGLILASCDQLQTASPTAKRLPRIGFLGLNAIDPAVAKGVAEGLALARLCRRQKPQRRVPCGAGEGRKAARTGGRDGAPQFQAIVVGSMPSLQAAFDATRAVPIIMAGAADEPVGSGFIASLAGRVAT